MAAKDEMSTSQWVQFFRAAGLPQQVSVQYAVVFADNRIQWGMLMDLTKEYLFDMGIHTMGDVIAILKHAKHVHSQEAQEKLMRSTPSSGTKLAVGIPRRYTPMKASERAAVVAEASPVSRVSFQSDYEQPVEPRATVRPLSKRRMADEEPMAAAPVAPKRLGIGSSASHRAAPLQPTALPAHKEGPTLKVVLPSGATARTRQLLAAANQGVSAGTQVAGKRSVFDRLGESTVSSTTDSSLMASSKGASTVFQRLGPSTGGGEEEVEPARTVLTTAKQQFPSPYQAVLAAAAKPSRVIRLNAPSTAARAVARRQVLPPSSSARLSVRGGGGGDSEGGGGVMLRRSLSEAASARLGAVPGRFASKGAGIAPAVISQRLGTARDRLGPKVALTTASTVRRTTIRTAVLTSPAVVAARKGTTVVPTSKRAVMMSSRAGFSESTAAPQNVFSRLGGNRQRDLIL